MFDGWTKHFLDGYSECGDNEAVMNKKASWSRGRLDNMWATCLKQGDQHIHISGLGDYWQSDDYEVCIAEKWPTMVTRRIQKKLTVGDVFVDIKRFSPNAIEAYVGSIKDLTEEPRGTRLMLSTDDIGKWFTLEMDLTNETERYYLADNKL